MIRTMTLATVVQHVLLVPIRKAMDPMAEGQMQVDHLIRTARTILTR